MTAPQTSPYAPSATEIEIARVVSECKTIVEEEFPDLWPAFHACLAVCATLRLSTLDNCVALLLVGPPASGKGTVLTPFTGGTNTVRVDKFTAASWVANTMNKTKQELAEIDLITQVQHKVMITLDLGTTLRGTVDQLRELFKTLTAVLDSHGYAPATASVGHRQVVGDYAFCWLGGTTPIPPRTWQIQNELGSRLLFFDLARSTPLRRLTKIILLSLRKYDLLLA